MPTTLAQRELEAYKVGEIDIWVQKYCGAPLEYLGCHRITGVSMPKGDINIAYCRTGKGKYEAIRTWRGAPGVGTMTIEAYEVVMNWIEEIGCPFQLYAMVGACPPETDPTNYHFIKYFEAVEVTSVDEPALAALTPEDEAMLMVSTPCSFMNYAKVKKIWEGVEYDVHAITGGDDIRDIVFCNDPSCGDVCTTYAPLCTVGYFVTDGTLYAPHSIGQTMDGGGTWSALGLPAFTANTDMLVAVCCAGDMVIVVNGTSPEYAYSWDAGLNWIVIDQDDGGTPLQQLENCCMWGALLWLVAAGGYIYYSPNRGASVEVQDAGIAAGGEDLYACSFASSRIGYAVGNRNTIVKTTDGGANWYAITGPPAGGDLRSVCAIPGTNIVWVADATGQIWRSLDAGAAWGEITLGVAIASFERHAICFDNCNFGFVVGNMATGEGVLLRTIDGGNTWEQIPIGANWGLNAVFCCDHSEAWYVGDISFIGEATGSKVT